MITSAELCAAQASITDYLRQDSPKKVIKRLKRQATADIILNLQSISACFDRIKQLDPSRGIHLEHPEYEVSSPVCGVRFTPALLCYSVFLSTNAAAGEPTEALLPDPARLRLKPLR